MHKIYVDTSLILPLTTIKYTNCKKFKLIKTYVHTDLQTIHGTINSQEKCKHM